MQGAGEVILLIAGWPLTRRSAARSPLLMGIPGISIHWINGGLVRPNVGGSVEVPELESQKTSRSLSVTVL